MRKAILLFALVLLILSGCGHPDSEATQPQTIPETSIAATEAPTAAPTEAPTEVPTKPPHSDLYIPDVSADDVVLYFNEVCLSAEFINSGDPSFLQRWSSPISYTIYGAPTPEDTEKIEEFAQWLNTIEGFPGIYKAGEGDFTNLRIHFYDEAALIDLMGDNFHGCDGAVTFWYTGDNAIYDAIICIRTDIDQHIRNSVILEELYNGLGPVQDTSLRADSLIYSGYSEPQALTELDELILKLLYHPSLSCGMDAAQCEAAIRELYY